jgi:hypothetical protein
LPSLSNTERTDLVEIFEKRHPITHNLGIIDRRYLARARQGSLNGREIRVTSDDVDGAIEMSMRVFRDVYARACGAAG